MPRLISSINPRYSILACECGHRAFVDAGELKHVCPRCGARTVREGEPVATKEKPPAPAVQAPVRRGRKA